MKQKELTRTKYHVNHSNNMCYNTVIASLQGFPLIFHGGVGERRGRSQQSFLQRVWDWSSTSSSWWKHKERRVSPNSLQKTFWHNRPLQETSEYAWRGFVFLDMWIKQFQLVMLSNDAYFSNSSRKSERPWSPSQLWDDGAISRSSR